MLFADKQNLETDLKVSLLAIRERELDLYTDNCRNIGAQAALLAGFAYSALTFEVADVNGVCTAALAMESNCDVTSRSTIFGGLYQLVALASMMLNFAAAFGSTFISMLGPGLALRGQDGAMDQAVEGLALEYRTTFLLFLSGIFSYFMCFMFFFLIDYDENYGWADLILHVLLLFYFLYFVRSTLSTLKRIWKKFRLPPEVAVAGNFDTDGVSIGGRSPESLELERLSVHKTWRHWPRRQYLYATIFMDEFLGISNKVYQERYQKSAREKASSAHGRPRNLTLHTIIRYLEKPSSNPFGSHHTATLTHSGSPAHGRGAEIASSTRSRPTGSGAADHSRSGGGKWWLGGWRNPEEKLGLAGHDSAGIELELSAMRPSDHLQSGAISPADSDSTS